MWSTLYRGRGGGFSVKTFYNKIVVQRVAHFTVKIKLGGKEVPRRLSLFAWTVYWDLMLTTHNLQVWG